MNAIEIKNISKAYENFKLDDLNLTLPCGCIMGLVGENGAGKSTTIKLILNMIKADSGSITIMGRDNQTDILDLKEDIGVVMDEIGIHGCLNSVQTGKILQSIYKNWDPEKYLFYIDKLQIPDKKPFKEFSKGMKMKLAIAIALSHKAKLLILDEATGGLDPVIRDEVLDIFSEFTRNEENSVLISSHIVSDLEKICDYIAFLHKGKLMLLEEKDAIYEKYGMIRCTKQEFSDLDPDAIVGKRENPYGIEAIAKRDMLPAGSQISAVSIEDLFIFMVKGER